MKHPKGIWAIWVIETLGILACAAVGVWLVLMRRCQWELILGAVWSVLLPVLAALLFHAERKAARKRQMEYENRKGGGWIE